MTRCEQKGPHQQVRFWLAPSVLPTARGIASLAGPAHASHPGLCQRLCREGVDRPAREEARATTLASPSTPTLTPPTTGWSSTIARSSWSCPLTWDPAPLPWSLPIFSLDPSGSLKTLLGTWRPAQSSGASPRQAPHHVIHSPTRKAAWGLPGGILGGWISAQWRAGHYCSFFAALSMSLFFPISAL